MPSFVGHALVALSVGAPWWKTSLGKVRPVYGWLAILLLASLLPDLDVLMWPWFPYSHPLGHRGLSHSLFFALLASLGITIICYLAGLLPGRALPLTLAWLLLAAVMGSHGLLDALTNGGLGVGLLSPFSVRRYFFPLRPLPVAAISPWHMLSSSMLHVYLVELVLFGPFCLAAWLSVPHLSRSSTLSTLRWLAALALVIVGVVTWLARCQSL
jgi:inner membrane protein